MKCLKCEKEHDGSYGSGKFCSRSCANSRIRNEITRKKISDGVLNSGWWKDKNFSHNSNPEKIIKNKTTWKEKRNWETAHISSIKKWYKEEMNDTCEECGLVEWNGKPLSKEVDHIDGNTNNNSKDNLRLLCPNCHSQTDTWRRKKKKRDIA